jgi:arabinan endo-1,5-alpha-L-arabinosidase
VTNRNDLATTYHDAGARSWRNHAMCLGRHSVRTPHRNQIAAGVTRLAALLLLLTGFAMAQEKEMYTNPVFERDFPDPDVLLFDGVYYAYATNTPGFNIQVARSSDLVTWELLSDAMPKLPNWALQRFGYAWAPEVTTLDGETLLMYFTARYATGHDGLQCIGLATSSVPEGPFAHVGDDPFVCQAELGGSIDASLFVDDDGTPYLLWKNDGNAVGRQVWLWISELSADGREQLGTPTQLITPDQVWEGILVEAPTLWKHEGRYYLFYSANAYDSANYAIGYAVADDILGPYEKPTAGPLLATSIRDGVVGPGGQDIVTGPDGNTWLLYHAWSPGSYRHLHLARLLWDGGVPQVDGAHLDPQFQS